MSLSRMLRDESWQRLLRGSAVTLLLRVIGAALELALGVVVARALGLSGTGEFMAGLTLATAMSVLARLGLDNSLLRLVAADSAEQRWDRVASTARRGLLLAAAVSLALTALLASALWIGMPASTQRQALLGMTLCVAPMSLSFLHGELLKAVGRNARAQWVAAVMPFLLSLLLMAGPLHALGLYGMVLAYALGATAAAAVGMLWWRDELRAHATQGETVAWSVLLSGSAAMLMVKLLRLGTPWLSTGALALWAGSAEIGIYGAAQRISVVTALLLIAVNAVSGPQFAVAMRNGDSKALQRSARRATVLACLFGGPVVMVLLFAPGWIMQLYGSAFVAAGAPVLAVLALGQAINVLTGPVNYLLLMSGCEQALLRSVLLSFVIGAMALLLLVPDHGALGAAIATALAMTVQNLGSAWVVWRQHGIVTMPGFARWSPAR